MTVAVEALSFPKPSVRWKRKNAISMREFFGAAHEAPSLKKWREKLSIFGCFPNFAGKQQHFPITNEKPVERFLESELGRVEKGNEVPIIHCCLILRF